MDQFSQEFKAVTFVFGLIGAGIFFTAYGFVRFWMDVVGLFS